MKSINNPYSPGAGTPPPELAGREEIINHVNITLERIKHGKPAKSLILLGLRGVGKTVLLNQFEIMAEDGKCKTAFFEVDPFLSFPNQITPQLYRLLLQLNRIKKVGNDIQKAFRLLRGFASAFQVKYESIEFGVLDEKVTGDLIIDLTDLFVAIGESAKSRNTTAVILIDEIQYVTQNDLSAIIMALHKISQKQLPLVLLGAGLPQLAKLAGNAKSYAERLFDYKHIGRLDIQSAKAALVKPAKKESVLFQEDALIKIVEETECYPFFLQVWGLHAWEVAPTSPITLNHVKKATKIALETLDKGFFQIRFDRLTERQQEYARAMTKVGLQANSSAVANELGLTVKQAAPIRDEIIKKGMAYSPRRGYVSFTVPKFDDYINRRKK